MKWTFNAGFFLLCLYLILDVTIRSEEGAERPIVQVFSAINLLIMGFYALQHTSLLLRLWHDWRFVKAWSLFIALMFLYYILAWIEAPSLYASRSPRELFIALFIIFTLIFVYIGSIKNHLNLSRIRFLAIIILINGLVEIYLAVSQPLLRQGMEVINTSAGYIFVMVTPLFMYLYSHHFVWAFSATTILTLATGKRGALVACVLIFLNALQNYRLVFARFRWSWKSALFLLILSAAFILFMQYALDSLLFRIDNIQNQEKGTIASGRDVIWLSLLRTWLDGNFASYIFGYGYYSTGALVDNVAHNDVIQYLLDYGLLGLSIYILTLLLFYFDIRRIRRYDRYIYMLLTFCLFVWIVRGLIAGTNRTDQLVLAISMGYLMSITTNAKYHKN